MKTKSFYRKVTATILLVVYILSSVQVEARSWFSLYKLNYSDGISYLIDGKSIYLEPEKIMHVSGDHTVYIQYPDIFKPGVIIKQPVKKSYDLKFKIKLIPHIKPAMGMFFLVTPERREYNFLGGVIKLDLTKTVFPPSDQGAKNFLSAMSISPGEKVIDIGTGSGILAIASAKMGGNVYATDIHKDATDLASHNASLNNVKLKTSYGSYFADFNEKFDVIIANLPHEAFPIQYQNNIGKHLAKTIKGGKNGNEIVLDFLKVLPEHMHNNSRAYMCAYGLSDYQKTLSSFTENFNTRLIKVISVPVKDFVKENADFYKKLADNGKAVFFKEKGEWRTLLYFVELRKSSV